MTKSVGSIISKGDEIGHFEFGGSTLVTLFAPSLVRFDDDLVFTTRSAVEQFVKVRTRIGHRAPTAPGP